MCNFNYALSNNEYSVTNALLWGNFSAHCSAAKTGSLGNRIVHVLIAIAEFLPLVSQIASLFEYVIISYFRKKYKEVSELPPLEKSPLEVQSFSLEDSDRLKKEYDEIFESNHFTREPFNEHFIHFVFELSDKIFKEHNVSRIFGIGQSPAWLLEIGRLRQHNPDRIRNIAFSGDWWGIVDEKGGGELVVPYEAPNRRKGKDIGSLTNARLHRMDAHQPNSVQVAAYRDYLASIGCSPEHIMGSDKQTVIVEYVQRGGGLRSFLEMLFEWGKELGINQADLSKKLNIHLIYQQSFVYKYFTSSADHRRYFTNNFAHLANNILFTEIGEMGEEMCLGLLFNKTEEKRRLIKKYPCSAWSKEANVTYAWNNVETIKLIYAQILIHQDSFKVPIMYSLNTPEGTIPA